MSLERNRDGLHLLLLLFVIVVMSQLCGTWVLPYVPLTATQRVNELRFSTGGRLPVARAVYDCSVCHHGRGVNE